MFEYLDTKMMVLPFIVIIICIVIMILKFKKIREDYKSFIGLYFFILSSLLIIYVTINEAYNIKYNIKNNIDYFKKDITLNCTSGFDNYLVLQKNNWKIDEDSFVKDSLIIRADKCQKK